MEHPLINPSLTPFCFTSPLRFARNRQNLKGVGSGINGDREMAKYWARANRLKNEGVLPAERIIHSVLASRFRPTVEHADFFFREKPYRQRDIFVLTCIVTWFGTTVGNSFLVDVPYKLKGVAPWLFFLRKYENENAVWKERYMKRFTNEPIDLLTFWTHLCTRQCENARHDYRNDVPSEIDYAVAEALMRWLGTKQGREFFSSYKTIIGRKHQLDLKACRIKK